MKTVGEKKIVTKCRGKKKVIRKIFGKNLSYLGIRVASHLESLRFVRIYMRSVLRSSCKFHVIVVFRFVVPAENGKAPHYI